MAEKIAAPMPAFGALFIRHDALREVARVLSVSGPRRRAKLLQQGAGIPAFSIIPQPGRTAFRVGEEAPLGACCTIRRVGVLG